MIMHIVNHAALKQMLLDGEYAPSSLQQEGFIHCSTTDQVLEVANSLYKGKKDLLLMLIDDTKVESEIVYEDLYELGKRFPHIYGPLNLDAIIQTLEFAPDAEGNFQLPAGVLHS